VLLNVIVTANNFFPARATVEVPREAYRFLENLSKSEQSPTPVYFILLERRLKSLLFPEFLCKGESDEPTPLEYSNTR
jgi:hypothetical protein